MPNFWAKYATQTTFQFPLIKRGVVDFAQSGDYTPASTDAAISKDNGNLADTTNTVAINGGSPTRGASIWKLTLTGTELTAAVVTVQIVDAATKAIEDQAFNVYTYGHASAYFAGDWSDIVRLGLTALPNAAAAASGGLIILGSNNTAAITIGALTTGAIACTTVTASGAVAFQSTFAVTGTTTLAGAVTASNASNNIVGIDVAKISGDATAADNAESFFDGTGYAGTNNVIPTVTTLTNLPTIPNNWLTAAGIAADAITAAKIADGAIDAATFASGAITASAIAADAIGASELASDAAAEIAAAVWDLDATAHQTQGTFGQAIGDPGADADSIWALANTNLDATVSSRLASASYTTPPTTAQIATGVWQDTTAGDFTTASSIGKSLYTSGVVPGAAGGLFIAGTNAATTVTTAFTTTFTGNLTGNVGGNVTGSIGSLATQAKADVNTEADTALADAGVTTTVTGRIDAAISTRATPAQILTTQLTESYASDGSAPTVTQALMLIQQMLTEITISGTTMTVKKLDGSTTAATLTLNSATTPTSVTRSG